MIPTLPTLATISRVYGVGMSYFFAEPPGTPFRSRARLTCRGNGRGVESTKVTPLNPATARTRLEAQMVEFTPGGVASAMEGFRREAGWFMCWKAGCSWRRAACRRCWKKAIAPIWRARWRWHGARRESIAAGCWPCSRRGRAKRADGVCIARFAGCGPVCRMVWNFRDGRPCDPTFT
jgi:hypothetical protein